MIADTLKKNGTIGLCSPCLIADEFEYQLVQYQMEKMGFQVKMADNMFSATYGYGATPQEKAADLMQLIQDPEVDLIMFGGGEGCNEVMPYLDYEVIKNHPKRICAFSDSTTLLNSIWATTGLEVYYGMSPMDYLAGLTEYNRAHFEGHILSDDMKEHLPVSSWTLCNEGSGEGILFGGYARNVALMLDNRYFPVDKSQEYILMIEDHEMFGDISYVSAILAHIEQHDFMKNIKGMLFGHYSIARHPEFYARLERLGKAHGIPVAYCDDFGHGPTSAIFPIGRRARLEIRDGKGTLTYI